MATPEKNTFTTPESDPVVERSPGVEIKDDDKELQDAIEGLNSHISCIKDIYGKAEHGESVLDLLGGAVELARRLGNEGFNELRDWVHCIAKATPDREQKEAYDKRKDGTGEEGEYGSYEAALTCGALKVELGDEGLRGVVGGIEETLRKEYSITGSKYKNIGVAAYGLLSGRITMKEFADIARHSPNIEGEVLPWRDTEAGEDGGTAAIKSAATHIEGAESEPNTKERKDRWARAKKMGRAALSSIKLLRNGLLRGDRARKDGSDGGEAPSSESGGGSDIAESADKLPANPDAIGKELIPYDGGAVHDRSESKGVEDLEAMLGEIASEDLSSEEKRGKYIKKLREFLESQPECDRDWLLESFRNGWAEKKARARLGFGLRGVRGYNEAQDKYSAVLHVIISEKVAELSAEEKPAKVAELLGSELGQLREAVDGQLKEMAGRGFAAFMNRGNLLNRMMKRIVVGAALGSAATLVASGVGLSAGIAAGAAIAAKTGARFAASRYSKTLDREHKAVTKAVEEENLSGASDDVVDHALTTIREVTRAESKKDRKSNLKQLGATALLMAAGGFAASTALEFIGFGGDAAADAGERELAADPRPSAAGLESQAIENSHLSDDFAQEQGSYHHDQLFGGNQSSPTPEPTLSPTMEPTSAPTAEPAPAGEGALAGYEGVALTGEGVADGPSSQLADSVDYDGTIESAASYIDIGEGWYDTFEQMGLSEGVWRILLEDEQLMTQLQEMGLAYPDDSIGGWGINMTADGKMPQEALDLIRQSAFNHGFAVVA